MNPRAKFILLEVGVIIGFPLLAWCLIGSMGIVGLFLLVFLIAIWSWQLFAFFHYRYCRQEEFIHILQTAAATKAPVESMLHAYLEDRPREHVYRGALLFFVFPGYYWIHLQRSFDTRLRRLASLLESGVPLIQALRAVPGLVSRQVALSVAVGQFTGRLPQALEKLPERKLTSVWLELGPRLMYPLLLLTVMIAILSFIVVFIIPKFERMFLEFRMKLPESTEILIVVSRAFVKQAWMIPILMLGSLVWFNLFLFSSRVKWYFPFLGGLYRMHTRGEFLQTLGVMMESGQPLPGLLDRVLDSELLPTVMHRRVSRLAEDLREGVALAESLEKRGLATPAVRGLVAAAERANNLPWALQEIGDSLMRRSVRLSQRTALIGFPLAILFCALLIGFIAVSMFSPLIEIIENLNG